MNVTWRCHRQAAWRSIRRTREEHHLHEPLRAPTAAPAPLIQGLFLAALLLSIASPAHAVFLSFHLPGAATYRGWSDLNFTNYPGYPFFPGGGLWPGPNVPGSDGQLDFDKISGNGYPVGSSIYAPPTSSVFGTENAALTAFDIEALAFQMDIGPSDGLVFFDAMPTLNYNGGTPPLVPNFEESNPADYPSTNPKNPAEPRRRQASPISGT